MSYNTQQKAQQKDTIALTKTFTWKTISSFFSATWGSC